MALSVFALVCIKTQSLPGGYSLPENIYLNKGLMTNIIVQNNRKHSLNYLYGLKSSNNVLRQDSPPP